MVTHLGLISCNQKKLTGVFEPTNHRNPPVVDRGSKGVRLLFWHSGVGTVARHSFLHIGSFDRMLCRLNPI